MMIDEKDMQSEPSAGAQLAVPVGGMSRLLWDAAKAIQWHLEPNSPDEHEALMKRLYAAALAPSASPAALTEGQREAILEVMDLARDEGLPGTAETLQSILAASPSAPQPAATNEGSSDRATRLLHRCADLQVKLSAAIQANQQLRATVEEHTESVVINEDLPPPTLRCQCCGYLVTESEHRGCLRAALPAPASGALIEALESIRQYGSDTLSGRSDGGPDDRKWQRDAVLEMARRASAAIAASQAEKKGEK